VLLVACVELGVNWLLSSYTAEMKEVTGATPVSALYQLFDGSRMAAAGGLAGVIARTATAPLDRCLQ